MPGREDGAQCVFIQTCTSLDLHASLRVWFCTLVAKLAYYGLTVQHEIAVMKKLDNPYCIRLLEVIEDSKAVHLIEEL